MKLSKLLNKNNNSKQITFGKVISSNYNTIDVSADTQYKNTSVVVPYGIAYKMPIDKKIYVLPTTNENIALGTINLNDNLQEGELMLYSEGGAKIILKNDGSVHINDYVFKAGN